MPNQSMVTEFEASGREQVRLKLQANLYLPHYVPEALAWLAIKDADADRLAAERRSREAVERQANDKALRASNITIIRLAALTLLATVLAWLFPRH